MMPHRETLLIYLSKTIQAFTLKELSRKNKLENLETKENEHYLITHYSDPEK